MAVTNPNVKFNACFDGAHGATSFAEKASGVTVSRSGNATLSTSSPLYPPSSGVQPDATSWWSSNVTLPSPGTGNYTIDIWYQTTGACTLFSTNEGDIWFGITAETIDFYTNVDWGQVSTHPLSIILTDGNPHCVSIQRTGTQLDFFVDDFRLFYGAVTTTETTNIIGTAIGIGKDLYPGSGEPNIVGKTGGARVTVGQALYDNTSNYRTFPSPYDFVGSSGVSVTGAQTLAPVSQVATNKAYVLIPGGTSTGTYSILAFSDAFDSIAPPTLEQTLAGVTQTATGVVVPLRSLTGAQTLGGVTQTAVAKAIAGLSGAQALDSVAQAGALVVTAGAVGFVGAQTLAGVTQAATLGAPAAITGTQTLAPVTQAATLATQARAQGAQTLSDVSQIATLTSLTHLQGAQALDGVVQVATSTVTAAPGVTGSQVLAGVTQTATLTSLTHAAGAQTLDPVTQSASAIVLPVLHATGAQILENVAQVATAKLLAKASGAQTLDPVTQVATAGQQIGFHGAQVLGGVVQLGTLSVFDTVFHYTGAQVLAGVHQLGRIQHEYIFEENVRTRHIGGEDRGYGIIAQERGTVTGPEDRGYGIDPENRGYVSMPQERTHTITP